MQNILVQAQYWHDPLHFQTYVEKSLFIAEINNEKAVKNESYAVNLATLENFVLVKHTEDGMVEPRESEHFEFYTPGQSDVIMPLRAVRVSERTVCDPFLKHATIGYVVTLFY